MSANGQYIDVNISFKDSYKLIASPLRNFSKMFDLEQDKEIMPYDVFTPEFIEGDFLLDPEVIKDLYGDEYYHEMQCKIHKYDCEVCFSEGQMLWDMLKYVSVYCKLDVEVLSKGWECFREMALDAFNIDINGQH